MKLPQFLRKISSPLVQSYRKWYHRKQRIFRYKNVEVNVLSGVFSPITANSTRALLDFINALNLAQKTVLELGCGSGIVSVLASEKNAIVTSSDVNDVALNELAIKARQEGRSIIPVYSDLFENLPFSFDFILINPPYIPQNPKTVAEASIKCGENFSFFNRLFAQLRVRITEQSYVLMVLPEEAEIFAISRRAAQNHLKLKTQKVFTIRSEKVVVYRIVADE